MNIKLLKAIDSSGGRLLVRILSHPETRALSQPRSFLIIRPGGIGDAVLLIPALSSLKQKFPHAVIHVLAEKRNSAAFSLCTCIDRIFQYDAPGDLLKALRGSYDVVIDTEQWHRLSAAAARLNNAPMLVGFATNERQKLFTHPVPYSHDDYEIHSFFNLIAPLTEQVLFNASTPFLTIPESHTRTIRPHLHRFVEQKIAAIFPGGSIREKRWGDDKFRETAKAFIREGLGVAVLGGKNDIKSGNVIAEGLPGTLNLCAKLSLMETAAVLKESAFLVAGDSGLMHIAYGLGTRTLALFGPSNVKKWAPRGERCITLNKDLDCGPCSKFGYTPKCNKNALCMGAITVEEVCKAALSLLGNSTQRR